MPPKKNPSPWEQYVRGAHMVFWLIVGVGLLLSILAYFSFR